MRWELKEATSQEFFAKQFVTLGVRLGGKLKGSLVLHNGNASQT